MVEKRLVELVGGPLDGVREVYEVIDGWVAARHNEMQQDYYSGQPPTINDEALVCYHDSHPEGLTIGLGLMASVVKSQYPNCEISFRLDGAGVDYTVKCGDQQVHGRMARMFGLGGREERPDKYQFRSMLFSTCRQLAGPPASGALPPEG
jgi:hypothetical protein